MEQLSCRDAHFVKKYQIWYGDFILASFRHKWYFIKIFYLYG